MGRRIGCSASATPVAGSSKGSLIRQLAEALTLPSTFYLLPPTFYLLTLVYIELHAASAFSFLQGAALPESLVERAATLGYPALALLDADGVYGAPRFHKAALKAGIRPIIGAELTIAGGKSQGSPFEWRSGCPEP